MLRLALIALLSISLPAVAQADWLKPQHRDAVIERMIKWEAVPPSDWPRSRGATIMDLLDPLVGGFPSRMEGRPAISIEVRKLKEDRVMLAHVQMRGFLDDSVNGEEFTALIGSADEGWTLIALWRRHECARGRLEGRWVTTPCS